MVAPPLPPHEAPPVQEVFVAAPAEVVHEAPPPAAQLALVPTPPSPLMCVCPRAAFRGAVCGPALR